MFFGHFSGTYFIFIPALLPAIGQFKRPLATVLPLKYFAVNSGSKASSTFLEQIENSYYFEFMYRFCSRSAAVMTRSVRALTVSTRFVHAMCAPMSVPFQSHSARSFVICFSSVCNKQIASWNVRSFHSTVPHYKRDYYEVLSLYFLLTL